MFETIYEEKDSFGYHKRSIRDQLFKERSIFIEEEFSQQMASIITKQLFLLEKQSDADINLYINSPGGSVDAGIEIFDVMQKITPKVNVIVTSMAASMGAFILAGATGKRIAYPNATIMIHTMSAGTRGDVVSMRKQSERIRISEQILNGYMSAFCGIDYDDYEEIINDAGPDGIYFMGTGSLEISELFKPDDKYLKPLESALSYGERGLIDEIIDPKNFEEIHGRKAIRPLKPGEKYNNRTEVSE